MNNPRILILGVGNVLLSDEGIGIHVIRELEKYSLPPAVKVLDGGTTGFELIRLFENMHKVIIVDAIKTDMVVGTLVRLTSTELQTAQELPFSVHQTGISSIIQQANLFYPNLELVLFGVVVNEIKDFNMQLSDSIRDRIPAIISAILKEISVSHSV